MRQFSEPRAILSSHGRFDQVDQLPCLCGEFSGQSLHETRVASELGHLLKQYPVDALLWSPGRGSGERTGAIRVGEDLAHSTQQGARIDGLGEKQVDPGVPRVLTKIDAGC